MNPPSLRVSLRVNRQDPAPAAAAILEQYSIFAARVELPVSVRLETHLILDEVVANITRHGLSGTSSCHVSVAIDLVDDYLHVEIADDSAPFDPLAHRAPAGVCGEMPDGSFGLLLTKRFADGLAYRREGGRNRLTFQKRVPYVRLRQLLRARK